jgi:glycosyltransferase involved in cell wall biosynthesis
VLQNSDKPSRVLLVVAWYPASPARRSLFHELVDALRDQGAVVDVIALDWRDIDQMPGAPKYQRERQLQVFRFNPVNVNFAGNKIKLVLKWALSSWRPVPIVVRLMSTNSYDQIIVSAPSALYMTTLVSLALSKARKYLIQWDFFPFSEVSIGLFRSKAVFNIFHMLQSALVRRFHVIGCMSEGNIAFLRKNYRLRRDQSVELLPIWGNPRAVAAENSSVLRSKYDIPASAKIAVFGGTLAQGRGLDDILEAAKLIAHTDPGILFLIVGTGPLENEFRAAAADVKNVRVLKYIPREDYLKFLTVCDCGIVATQRDTGLPTFPSKTIDYFRAGVPVVASVENTTDYGTMLEANKAAIAVAAGNCEALARAVSRVMYDAELRDEMAANGRLMLQTHFNVELTAAKLLRNKRAKIF